MSVTLTISEKTYKKLQSEAERKGFQNVEQFLEKWEVENSDNRYEVVERIKEFQKRMREKYGVMPNSVDLIREDRNR